MEVYSKGLWILLLVFTTTYIDMYQDRSDRNKTIIVIEQDDTIQTLTVDNKDLNKEATINKIQELVHDKATDQR